MSFAPRNVPKPLVNPLNPFMCVDFVQNHAMPESLTASPPPNAVFGGPPAYLEAHGIRYVPLGHDEAEEQQKELAAEDKIVPMSRKTQSQSEKTLVSKAEVDAHVQQRVKEYLAKDVPGSPQYPARSYVSTQQESGSGYAQPSRRLASVRNEANDFTKRLQELRAMASNPLEPLGLASAPRRVVSGSRPLGRDAHCDF